VRLQTEAEWEHAARLHGGVAGMPLLHPGAVPEEDVRPLLALDQQQLRTVSALPHGAGRHRRIQRQVHGQSIRAARLVMCEAGGSCPGQLPQFLPGRGALAFQCDTAGALIRFARRAIRTNMPKPSIMPRDTSGTGLILASMPPTK